MKNIFALAALLFSSGMFAQSFPKDYFRNPLDIPILLAGNFGECRPNHFHTGLDFKTNERENLRVSAAAEGFVSRISISHSGYGNALYIQHPNGYTTVYAHLNDFFPALQQYVVAKQYELERWNIDIQLKEDEFPVTSGQFIAFSGTTGGSTGPHLHFEIRDTRSEHVLNAALFGLPIKDTKPPVPYKLALYQAGSIYQQEPRILPLKKSGTSYTTSTPLIKTPSQQVRLAVFADDFMEGSPNKLGVHAMKLFMDGNQMASWQLDEIDFDLNRYVNAFADFRLKSLQKDWFQTLFRIPGNHLNSYTFLNERNGALELTAAKLHNVKIELWDVMGNRSEIAFQLQWNPEALPPSSSACAEIWTAGKSNSVQTPNLSFSVGEKALYDDLCFKFTETPSTVHWSSVVQIMGTEYPLQTYSELRLKLNKLLPFELRTKLVFVHHIRAASLPGNNPQTAMAARFNKGWAVADVRTFGNYYVTVDTIPPQIIPHKNNNNAGSSKLQFTVTDKLTSVKDFRAELDGKWLRFVRTGNTYTYVFDQRCAKGKHLLTIKARDENDNESVFVYNFTR
jgi:hypothetical protein